VSESLTSHLTHNRSLRRRVSRQSPALVLTTQNKQEKLHQEHQNKLALCKKNTQKHTETKPKPQAVPSS